MNRDREMFTVCTVDEHREHSVPPVTHPAPNYKSQQCFGPMMNTDHCWASMEVFLVIL